jgi:hypothetical protein
MQKFTFPEICSICGTCKERVILEVCHVSFLYPSKNEMAFKITIYSKFNNDKLQAY